MATNLTNTTFNTTYKDDYKDSDNYHRVLFNSGKALQARELTQLQTIIQNEIARFGSSIFREGGAVTPGGLTLNKKKEFIKLVSGSLPADVSDIIGQTFTVKSPDAAIQVKILQTESSTATEPETLYVEYVSTSAGTSGTDPIRVGNGVTLENTTLGSTYDMVVASSDATGVGLEVSNARGSFFTQGHFVFADKQSKIISKYSVDDFTGEVGFKIEEQVVTVGDDLALYDNQGASPNIAAPGADRYRIRLTLTTKAETSATDNFIYLANIQDGSTVDETSSDNSFSLINDVLAKRTREESGDYIVKPFIAQFENLNDSNLTLNVTDGIAYVDGYRLEASAQSINVPKAQDTITKNNEIVVVQYGNYVLGNLTNNKGLPNINTFEKVTLKSAANFGGSTIGTARVRHIEEDGANLRFYIFDIRMNSGSSFSQTVSFGTGATDYMNLILESSAAVLKSTSNNDLLFPLPSERPTQTGITPDEITIQKRYTFSTTSGQTSVTNAAAVGSGLTFTNASSWILSEVDGPVDTDASFTLNGSNTNFDVANLTQSKSYELIALVKKASPTARAKTLNETTMTKAWSGDVETDANGNEFLSLDKSDIFQVVSIKVADSNGADLSTSFTVDNGQRDNFYGIGRIVPKGGVTVPTGNVFVRFKYFTHGAGEFFNATSYNPAQVSYDEIPSHRQNNGNVVSLRDVMDFRPVATKAATNGVAFDSDGAGGDPLINLLPQNTGTFTADIVYYQPRADRLVLTPKTTDNIRVPVGELKYVQGASDIDPKTPETPTGALPLYDFDLNAYTLDDSDLSSARIPAKRFTMADIGDLEQRINKIEELTSLSLLELDTSNLTVVDSAGLERTKSGFLVDNFYNYDFSDISRDNYRAAIDDVEGILTPQGEPHSCRLIYDSADGSTTTVRKGDNVYLPIDSDVLFMNQNIATERENINPFAVITSNGHLVLSPETDNWVETKYNAVREVSGGTITNETGRIIRGNPNAWRNNWIGRVRQFRNPDSRRRGGRIRQEVSVRLSDRVRREIINDRIVDISIIPFMRSIKVYFKATSLRRGTKHFAFFGDQDISNYIREETFQRWSTRGDQAGNTYSNTTSHPDGATALISDSNGEIEGSFIIPSSSSLRFQTGSRTFKLVDVTSGNKSASLSNAQAIFTSAGVLQTRQQTIRSTRLINTARVRRDFDPLAQSFLINSTEHSNGMFITKARIFFSTKEADGGVPVEVSIVPLVSGYPDEFPVPGAVKTLNPNQVSVPTDTESLTAVRAAPTDFVFDEPVYLAAGERYAIVIKADSTEYTVYVAKTGEFLLGSTEQRVQRQPSLGSLFMSQNASTWTADQERDLMFGLFHAQFQTSAAAILENGTTPNQLLDNNPLFTEASGDEIRVTHHAHGFVKNDYVTISGLDSSTTYAGLTGANIMGSRQITKVDHTGYTFNAAANATAALQVGGNGVIATQNQMFNQFVPQVSNVLPNNTTLSGKVKLTAGASYADNRNTASGYARTKDTSFSTVQLNDINLTDEPKAIFADTNEDTSPLSGARSLTMQLDLATTDNKVSPIVDLQRSSMLMFENIIDKQDSAATTGFNVPISFVNETHPTDGSSAAKHITKTVTLEEPGVGLKILFAANRPSVANFRVYFKTGTTDDNLDDVSFVEIAEETNNPADENVSTFRQYEYLAGGQVGNLDTFTQFQIKIVMESTNSSKIPRIKDLRTIALVT